MDTVMKRRTFLKGLMAAAAIPVLAQLPPDLVAEEVAEVVEASMPIVEPGELWFKNDGLWKFVGMVRNLTVERNYNEIEISSFSDPFNRIYRGIVEPPSFTADVYLDPNGTQIAVETLKNRDAVSMILAVREYDFQIPSGILRSVDQIFWGNPDCLQTSMNILATKPMTLTHSRG